MTIRRQATRALYEGSLAEPGDRNPYAGKSLAMAKCWRAGYERMLRIRIETGPAVIAHRAAARALLRAPSFKLRAIQDAERN